MATFDPLWRESRQVDFGGLFSSDSQDIFSDISAQKYFSRNFGNLKQLFLLD